MEPFDEQDLSDRELDALLPEWKAPRAPARLRAAVFPERPQSGWRKFWSASVHVPVPVACLVAMLLAIGTWRWFAPGPVRVVVRTERVEVPVVKTEVLTKIIYRDRIVRLPASPEISLYRLQPVAELRPHIIRSRHVEN